MRTSKNELKPTIEIPEGRAWTVVWGDMAIEMNDITAPIDLGPIYKGLPDDQCQCPHWGYVISGRVGASYNGRVEYYEAGDIFYMEPGHVPVIDGPAEYVVFSPKQQWAETEAVVERNLQTAL